MKNKRLEDLKMELINLQNELIDNVIIENDIDIDDDYRYDYIYDYTEYDDRIGTINDMIDILDDFIIGEKNNEY